MKSLSKVILNYLFFAFLTAFIVISFNTVSNAQSSGQVPGDSLGLNSDADLWRYIRQGNKGDTQLKNELSAVMIQSEGDNWRSVRNGV